MRFTRTAIYTIIAVAPCMGQSAVSSHVVVHEETVKAPVRDLEDITIHLDARLLHPVVRGSWEEQNLDVSTRGAKQRFHLDLSAPSGLYTLKTEREDILVAQWDLPDATTLAKVMWLWNAPARDTLIFEVDPSLLQPAALAASLERTAIWNDNDGPRSRVDLHVDPARAATGVGGADQGLQFVESWWVAAATIRDVAFISVAWHKNTSNENPLGTVFVSERFPPLASRLKLVSREGLFGELSRGRYVFANFGVRDEVAIRELVLRGEMSEADFRRLIFPLGEGPSGIRANPRLSAVLGALVRTKELARYVALIADLMVTTPAGPGLQYRGFQDAANLFAALISDGINPSDAALQLVRREEFTDACLGFLERFGKSQEIMKQLSETPVPPRFQAQKEQVLETNRYHVIPARPERK